MGPYPILCVKDWAKLGPDLDGLGAGAIAFSAVLDPLGNFDPKDMARHFPDLYRPFKEHLVVDLSGNWRARADGRHLRKAKRAQGRVQVE
jgi:hypothetical protein